MSKPTVKEPTYLYHGSMFNTEGDSLYPGIHHTGELVSWDGGLESNEFLYTTTDAKSAVLLGLGSLLEKTFKSSRYVVDKMSITVYGASGSFTDQDLVNLKVYLYTIRFHKADGWYKNSNPFNSIDTEWKTTHEVKPAHFAMVSVDILDWLKKNKYKLILKADKG